jgi:hypothetical protein
MINKLLVPTCLRNTFISKDLTTTKIVKETHRKRDFENGMKATNFLTGFSRRECSCIEQLMQL